ncbi:cation-independent mannose-6-phosphate receptor [Platysternon megacephalum]|uniref:Cation-independent mannose-6-phosphate receptor n=1 Tax=Platysternon megacephalum TaxID=55544 RepID=A0A4D9DWD5_9SAUR|nr:cation-independent mannose-6-phosphate receptor [Platysternon megacephalum]
MQPKEGCTKLGSCVGAQKHLGKLILWGCLDKLGGWVGGSGRGSWGSATRSWVCEVDKGQLGGGGLEKLRVYLDLRGENLREGCVCVCRGTLGDWRGNFEEAGESLGSPGPPFTCCCLLGSPHCSTPAQIQQREQ